MCIELLVILGCQEGAVKSIEGLEHVLLGVWDGVEGEKDRVVPPLTGVILSH